MKLGAVAEAVKLSKQTGGGARSVETLPRSDPSGPNGFRKQGIAFHFTSCKLASGIYIVFLV